MQPPNGATHAVTEDVLSVRLRPVPDGSTGADEGEGDGCVGDDEGDEPLESVAVGDGVCDGVGFTQDMSVTEPAEPVVIEPPTKVIPVYVAIAELT